MVVNILRMNENKKIAINSIVIFVRLIVTSIIGLVSSRLVLDALGASDYGLYNVVGGLVVLLNVLNTAMITTTYRYIAFELGKKEGNPNRIFCASLTIHFVFAVLILLIGLTIGMWYVSNYLNVPDGKISDASFVLVISIITTCISTFLVPYQGLLVAYEKFIVSALIDIITKSLYLGAIYYILVHLSNGLRAYAYIQLGLTVITGLCYLLYSINHYGAIVKLRVVREIALYKEMFSFTGWTLLGATASVMKTQGSAAVINYFFGTIVNAAFAVANQVQSFILLFSRNIAQAAIPQITKNLSGGNKDRSVNITCYISKYTFILMIIVAFPVIVELDFLLGLWLKEVPDGTSLICKLMIVDCIMACLGAGIPALVQATGKIRPFQIVSSILLIMPIPVSIGFFHCGFPVYYIIVSFILFNAILAVVRLILLKRVLDFDVKSFARLSYLSMLYMSLPLVVFYLIYNYIYNPSQMGAIGHLVGLLVSELFTLVVIWVIGLGRYEKEKVIITVKNQLKNRA